VLAALRLAIAGRAGVDPLAVALPLLGEYLPRLAAEGGDPVAVFVAQGRALGFMRPSPRTQIQAPQLPRAHRIPAPPHRCRERTPRYARRTCGPRPRPSPHPAHALE
jgi:hypothetical protein